MISALLSKSAQPFHIYALTRDAKSESAQSLASKPNVLIIESDLDDAEAIFKHFKQPPWGVFSVQLPLPNAKSEETQGKALTKAAVDAGVKHLVYTSADRGGDDRSEWDATPVPHFASKFRIEIDIQDKAKTSKQGMTWTILRPVAFMENLTPDFLGKGFLAMWSLNGMKRSLQLISTEDVGKIAADALINAESEEYRNKSLSIAGDEISPEEAGRIFKHEIGTGIPKTYVFVGRLLKIVLRDQLGIMFNWFRSQGFDVDVKAIRARYPETMDFGTWLRRSSKFRKQ